MTHAATVVMYSARGVIPLPLGMTHAGTVVMCFGMAAAAVGAFVSHDTALCWWIRAGVRPDGPVMTGQGRGTYSLICSYSGVSVLIKHVSFSKR